MANRKTLKLGMDKLWENANAIAFVIISVGRLAWPQGAIYAHFGSPLIFIFSQGCWNFVLMLFYSPKDLDFGEVLVFTNIFVFL